MGHLWDIFKNGLKIGKNGHFRAKNAPKSPVFRKKCGTFVGHFWPNIFSKVGEKWPNGQIFVPQNHFVPQKRPIFVPHLSHKIEKFRKSGLCARF